MSLHLTPIKSSRCSTQLFDELLHEKEKNQLNEIEKERQEISRLADQRKKIQQILENYEEILQEKEQLKINNSKLQQKLNQFKQLDDLNHKYIQLVEFCKALQFDNQKLSQEISHLKSFIQDRHNLKEENQQLQTHLQQLTHQFKQLQYLHSVHQQQQQLLMTRNLELENQLKNLTKINIKQQKEKEKNNKQKQQEIQILKNQIARIADVIHQMAQLINQKDAYLFNYQNMIKKLQDQVIIYNQNQFLSSQIQQALNKRAMAQKNSNMGEGMINTFKSELKQTVDSLDHCQKQLKNVIKNKKIIQKKLNEMENLYQQKQMQNIHLKKQIEQLQFQFLKKQQLKKHIRSLQEQNQILKEELAMYQIESQKLRINNNNLYNLRRQIGLRHKQQSQKLDNMFDDFCQRRTLKRQQKY